MVVKRVTLFKLKEEDVPAGLEAYQKLEKEAKKDGQPYILSVSANKLYNDPRSGGFTLKAATDFNSLEDMKYYDETCEAHAALKGVVGPKCLGPPTAVYWDA